ncbi:TPA: hypothetical protein TVN96_001217 [Streptococcus equi subsp. zooepidemicus]|nr:hypothetical protein [Streptococcus equi subsp. zooepidemicus]
MKKKLVMILALCAVGVSANVKAEVYGNQKVWGFRTDWEQRRDFGVRPIQKGDRDIRVKTAPEAVLTVDKWENNKWENVTKEIREGGTYNHSTYSRDGQTIYQIPLTIVAGGDGRITFPLKQETQLGEKYRLTLTVGGFYLAGGEWTVGDSVPRDIEEKDEAEIQQFVKELERKEREVEEQKYAEELFKHSVEEEANKAWYQRLGDRIQDQWYNIKSWWNG